MKKTYQLTYTNSLFQVVKQLKVRGTFEQATRFAEHYAFSHGLMGTRVLIGEVA